ncbi:MAG: hypothetical protein HOP29_18145 [Phycisphaerales bacterium]|nr:hypothetical protein [Phycisphaerales bacterium]
MTEHDAQQLDSLIDRMTDVERRALRDRLDRSVNGGVRPSPASDTMTPEEKRRLLEAFEEIANLPIEGSGTFSGLDHDEILYDGTGKRGFPEKPLP